jgi:hypothetical protein
MRNGRRCEYKDTGNFRIGTTRFSLARSIEIAHHAYFIDGLDVQRGCQHGYFIDGPDVLCGYHGGSSRRIIAVRRLAARRARFLALLGYAADHHYAGSERGANPQIE